MLCRVTEGKHRNPSGSPNMLDRVIERLGDSSDGLAGAIDED
ncbi:MAG: hypothetical protein ACYC6N_29465 [Pirellulaceae bacterium]